MQLLACLAASLKGLIRVSNRFEKPFGLGVCVCGGFKRVAHSSIALNLPEPLMTYLLGVADSDCLVYFFLINSESPGKVKRGRSYRVQAFLDQGFLGSLGSLAS